MDRSNILKAIDDAKRVVATCPTWKRKSDCVSRSMNDCLTAADALALSRRIEKIESDIHKIENVLEKVVVPKCNES